MIRERYDGAVGQIIGMPLFYDYINFQNRMREEILVCNFTQNLLNLTYLGASSS